MDLWARSRDPSPPPSPPTPPNPSVSQSRRARRPNYDVRDGFAREDELFVRDDDLLARVFEELHSRDDFERQA